MKLKSIAIALSLAILASCGAKENSSSSEVKTESQLSKALSDTTHLTFMGIAINGAPQEFAEAVKTKGFKDTEESGDDYIALTGRFAGQDDVMLMIGFDPKLNLTHTITVSIPADRTVFTNLAHDMSEKYAGAENGLNTGSCKSFRTDKGSVSISMMEIAGEDAVLIQYIDDKNTEASRTNNAADL
ncbi:hypothetical protein [Paramuribaculum intestinale]|uniref:hypothetical protein n=1 Tax=Paramuribaculum intestinale TaxID=2094151 RepID=UPI0025A970B4|nr:hypothetical protein [Paramuribaculum intestinale]